MSLFLLGQAGREELQSKGFRFILEAPWKACRICGDVCQTVHDREAYEAHECCSETLPYSLTAPPHTLCALLEAKGRETREEWLRRHNRLKHTYTELERFEASGLEVTAIAAQKLATYGIIHISTVIDPDEDQALLEAPRAPVNDAYSW